MGSSLSSVCFVPDLETNDWAPHYKGVISAMSGIKRYNRKIGITQCPGGLPLRWVKVAAAIRYGLVWEIAVLRCAWLCSTGSSICYPSNFICLFRCRERLEGCIYINIILFFFFFLNHIPQPHTNFPYF